MNVDLAQTFGSGVYESMGRSGFDHQDVARSCIPGKIADKKSRMASLDHHDLIVVVAVQKHSPPRLSVHHVKRDRHTTVIGTCKVPGTPSKRKILCTKDVHRFHLQARDPPCLSLTWPPIRNPQLKSQATNEQCTAPESSGGSGLVPRNHSPSGTGQFAPRRRLTSPLRVICGGSTVLKHSLPEAT